MVWLLWWWWRWWWCRRLTHTHDALTHSLARSLYASLALLLSLSLVEDYM